MDTASPKNCHSKGRPSRQRLTENRQTLGPIGGALIRRVIACMNQAGLVRPLSSHILIGMSGGVDSTALVTLLSQRGGNIIERNKIHILHFNHGWRGEESDGDQKFVETFSRGRGLTFHLGKTSQNINKTGESPEAAARKERKEFFKKVMADVEGKTGSKPLVFTAHHEDDLAETVLWRILTGAGETHGGGITLFEGGEIRPFLTSRKSELKAYLKEEGLKWREDSSNQDSRFLRAQLRQEVFPALEKIFPNAVPHLAQLGRKAQLKAEENGGEFEEKWDPSHLLGALGVRVRKAQYEMVRKIQQKVRHGNETKMVHLPQGWNLQISVNRTEEEWTLKRQINREEILTD